VNLVEQLRKDFIDYSEFNQFDVGKNVHTIYAGMSKHEQVPITISTWQSIYEMPKQWFKQFKAVIGDECHLYKAKSLKTIMENLSNATFRIGTTGSLDNSETNKLVLKGLFGPIKQVVQTSEMIESGQATPMKIKILVMDYIETDKAVLKADYRQQTEWFATNEKRNKFIRKLVASQEGNKLVLFNLVDKHGIPLYKAFKKEYPDKDIFYISGKTPVAEREEIRKKLDEIEVGIHLTFGKKIVVCQRNTEVPLTNGTYKKASEITKNDDVLDSWIEKESKKHK
jgi:superfamily II DNA or RNA helicase